MRVTLVEVFGNDHRLVQDEIAIHQRRDALHRIQVDQIFRRFGRIDENQIVADALGGEDQTDAMAMDAIAGRIQRENRARTGIQGHASPLTRCGDRPRSPAPNLLRVQEFA